MNLITFIGGSLRGLKVKVKARLIGKLWMGVKKYFHAQYFGFGKPNLYQGLILVCG